MPYLLFISTAEIFMIILVAVLLFGAKRLPEIARAFGKGMNEFRKATNDIKREINVQSGGIGDEIKKVKHQIHETSQEIEDNLNKADLLKDAKEIKKNLNKIKP